MKIIEQRESPLQGRKEVSVEIESTVTPSRKQVLEELCKQFGTQPELVAINRVHHPFGSKTITVTAKIYSSVELARKFEPAYRSLRGVKKQAAEAAPASG